MVLTTGWIGTEDTQPVYPSRAFREWTEEMLQDGKLELVDLVKAECRAFASVLVTSTKERLKNDWNHIQALELIDPVGPELDRHATPEVWDALRDLCSRRDIDFDLAREQIINFRAEAKDLDNRDRSRLRSDLCGYLRERHKGFVASHTVTPTPEMDLLCVAVFSISVVSAFVESLFSKMAYNQSKIRSRLGDNVMSSILHVHDSALPDPESALESQLQLKVKVPHSIDDKMTMSKCIGKRVCQKFDGVLYHGTVVEVIFHDVHAQYMYHVEFDDQDEADYWRHELDMITCRCTDV